MTRKLETENFHFRNREGEQIQYVSDSWIMERGVYEVEITCTTIDEAQTFFEIESESGLFKAVLNNTIPVYSGKKQRYSIIVMDKGPVHAYFYTLSNQVPDYLSMSFIWTSKGYLMVGFGMILVFLLIDSLLYVRSRIISGKLSKEQQLVLWCMISMLVGVSSPLLERYCYIGSYGLPYIINVSRLVEGLQVKESHAFLLIPSLLVKMGFPFYMAHNIFLFLIFVCTIGIAFYSFYHCFHSNFAALLGTAFYVLHPSFIISVYEYGEMKEILSATFLPLLFCGAYSLLADKDGKEKGNEKYFLIIGFSALLNCYVEVAIISLLTIGLLCLILWKRVINKYTILQLAETIVWILVLNFTTILDCIKNHAYDLQLIIDRGEHKNLGSSFLAILLFVLWLVWDDEAVFGKKNKMLVSMGMIMTCLSTLIWSNQAPCLWYLFDMLLAAAFVGGLTTQMMHKKTLVGNGIICLFGLIAFITALYRINLITFENRPICLYEAKNIGMVANDLIREEAVDERNSLLRTIICFLSWGMLGSVLLGTAWLRRREKCEQNK